MLEDGSGVYTWLGHPLGVLGKGFSMLYARRAATLHFGSDTVMHNYRYITSLLPSTSNLRLWFPGLKPSSRPAQSAPHTLHLTPQLLQRRRTRSARRRSSRSRYGIRDLRYRFRFPPRHHTIGYTHIRFVARIWVQWQNGILSPCWTHRHGCGLRACCR
jgi:hypothetical protein